MTHYLIAQVKVTNDSWIPEYAQKVHAMVHRHGGKYLSRSSSITAIEGDPPDVDMVALIEFPSMDALQAFINDPEYAPFAKARQDGTNSRFLVSSLRISSRPLLRPGTQGAHSVALRATGTTREWKGDGVSPASTRCVAGAPASWPGWCHPSAIVQVGKEQSFGKPSTRPPPVLY